MAPHNLSTLRAAENPPSTISPETLDTSAQPDTVIIEQQETMLTTSPESLARMQCKEPKRKQRELPASIKRSGVSGFYTASLIKIEIGALGH